MEKQEKEAQGEKMKLKKLDLGESERLIKILNEISVDARWSAEALDDLGGKKPEIAEHLLDNIQKAIEKIKKGFSCKHQKVDWVDRKFRGSKVRSLRCLECGKNMLARTKGG